MTPGKTGERPALVRRWFLPGIVVVAILSLGGCVAGLAVLANDNATASTGPADPEDYDVELRSCSRGTANPEASGVIRNDSEDAKRFRVLVEARDPVTGSAIARRSHYASLAAGAAEEFDIPVVDGLTVAAESIPDELVCAVAVFYAGN